MSEIDDVKTRKYFVLGSFSAEWVNHKMAEEVEAVSQQERGENPTTIQYYS